MRLALFALYSFLLIATTAFADVTTEILSQKKAPNGDMWVCVQYKIDGIEVASPYPKIDGKSCLMIRKNAYQLAGLDAAQTEALFDAEITAHAKTLIADEYSNKAVDGILATVSLVGRKQTVASTVVKVAPDKEWTVKTNGEKIEKVIAVEPVNP